MKDKSKPNNKHLNTSNVNVNPEREAALEKANLYLNTSNVNVNQMMLLNYDAINMNLNTSNVNVNLHSFYVSR